MGQMMAAAPAVPSRRSGGRCAYVIVWLHTSTACPSICQPLPLRLAALLCVPPPPPTQCVQGASVRLMQHSQQQLASGSSSPTA
jgi:hypothetical protein